MQEENVIARFNKQISTWIVFPPLEKECMWKSVFLIKTSNSNLQYLIDQNEGVDNHASI